MHVYRSLFYAHKAPAEKANVNHSAALLDENKELCLFYWFIYKIPLAIKLTAKASLKLSTF